MSVPSPFLINSFSFFCLLLLKSSATDLKCFWPFNSKELVHVPNLGGGGGGCRVG